MAAKNGHLEMVKFLVNELDVDIEQVSPNLTSRSENSFVGNYGEFRLLQQLCNI